MKKWIIAIDLHGTLLNNEWKILKNDQLELAKLMDELVDMADFYICTGNDYSFVKEYVPEIILNKIKGCVLETGCIVFEDKQQVNYIDNEIQSQLNDLKEYLQAKRYSFVKYFAKRESTISIFTNDNEGGKNPFEFYQLLSEDVSKHPFGESFYLTWSSVALDIVPVGFSKWATLKKLAEDKLIVSFMDSFNDKDIAKNSFLTFLPSNSSEKLISYLRSENKLVFPLSKFHTVKNQVFISTKAFSEGVIDGLSIFKNFYHRDK
ncbi:MAG: HAD hydrolase family protein [Candidatus Cloacimonetes bacterium]|jgi:hydroxymethylpyrimidine pyrophosphatase-like HAD family hydrolase|nr:HAD hydrolase family protein [Candidatus Cloacimonadota bacterium]MDD4155500.1 HAD hydrolase family protein [Candidatus Cloacimonadota bacterium]